MRHVAWVALAALLSGENALAEGPRTSSLSWVRLPGAESCAPTQELAQKVEARLRHPVFVSAAVAEVSVEGHIEPDAKHGFRAVITLRDAHGAPLGTRDVARPEASCDGMTEPLALIIAVMIDPDAALAARPTTPPVPAPVPASPPPAPVIVERPVYIAVPAPPPPPPPVWRVDVGAGGVTSLGLVRAPDVGLYASLLLEPPRFFPLEGFGALLLDDNATLSLAYAGAGACPLHHDGEVLRLAGCAIGELGLFTATLPANSPGRVYLAGGLEGRGSVRLVGPFAVRFGVNAVVPIFRTWTTDGTGTAAFRPSVVGAAADVGVGVVLP